MTADRSATPPEPSAQAREVADDLQAVETVMSAVLHYANAVFPSADQRRRCEVDIRRALDAFAAARAEAARESGGWSVEDHAREVVHRWEEDYKPLPPMARLALIGRLEGLLRRRDTAATGHSGTP